MIFMLMRLSPPASASDWRARLRRLDDRRGRARRRLLAPSGLEVGRPGTPRRGPGRPLLSPTPLAQAHAGGGRAGGPARPRRARARTAPARLCARARRLDEEVGHGLNVARVRS
jgi:hypothetical protein